MKTRTVYRKTIVFVWLRLCAFLTAVAIDVGLFLLLHTALSHIGEGPGTAGFIIWLVLTPFVFPAVKYFLFYRVKAGHLKAISEALATEKLPLNLLAECNAGVTRLYPTPVAYCRAEISATTAIKQLYSVIDGNASLFHGVQAKDWYIKFVKCFMSSYLSYIADSCVAYTFVQDEAKTGSPQANLSLMKGIAVFFTNWRALLVNAYKSTSHRLIASVVLFVLSTAGILTVLILTSGFGFITAVLAAVFGIMTTEGIKYAFIDPVYDIRLMGVFADAAETTGETPELYDKISNISSAFRKLRQKTDPDFAKKQAETNSALVNKDKDN